VVSVAASLPGAHEWFEYDCPACGSHIAFQPGALTHGELTNTMIRARPGGSNHTETHVIDLIGRRKPATFRGLMP
jgi:hypothetical protein